MTYEENLVSVITPAYNAARFIAETIESVLNQTYENWEMIIVDDCSQDETTSIIKKYQAQDERIHLIELEENSGSAVARNTAMDHAKGKYLAFLDSDDKWLPEKVAQEVAVVEEKDIDLSFTGYARVKEDVSEPSILSKVQPVITYDELMQQCVSGCLAVMLDREKIG